MFEVLMKDCFCPSGVILGKRGGGYGYGYGYGYDTAMVMTTAIRLL